MDLPNLWLCLGCAMGRSWWMASALDADHRKGKSKKVSYYFLNSVVCWIWPTGDRKDKWRGMSASVSNTNRQQRWRRLWAVRWESYSWRCWSRSRTAVHTARPPRATMSPGHWCGVAPRDKFRLWNDRFAQNCCIFRPAAGHKFDRFCRQWQCW